MDINADEVVSFWFEEEVKSKWFNSTTEFDALLVDKYLSTYQQAAKGELDDWKNTANGALALCIILDQFPLNMFRNDAASFATEAKAREIAEHAIERGFDQSFDTEYRLFLYLPFMHSENIEDQERCIALFEQSGMDSRFAHHHHGIVKKFGRFPHRNKALNRESTEEEIRYLESENAFHG